VPAFFYETPAHYHYGCRAEYILNLKTVAVLPGRQEKHTERKNGHIESQKKQKNINKHNLRLVRRQQSGDERQRQIT